MKQVTIYCDGSSIGNPGPGGWGAVVADQARVKEMGGFQMHTTNNRMELTAAIESLKLIRTPAHITIHTDSQYVINGITKWVFGWEQKGWITAGKTEVQNKDLWQALVKAVSKHDVMWKHVKGHAGVPQNERADQIANGFARKEKVELFYGSLAKYKAFVATLPKPRVVSSSAKKKGKAFSYVSLVEGKVMTHTTWIECEKRVKGKKAKFKKVFSKEEEESLRREWS